MTSTRDASSRNVKTALLSGLPVRSTGVFGVQERVTRGESGFTCPFDAKEDRTHHSNLRVTDHQRRSRMSVEAAHSLWKRTAHAAMLHSCRACHMQPLTADAG